MVPNNLIIFLCPGRRDSPSVHESYVNYDVGVMDPVWSEGSWTEPRDV